MDEFEVMRQQLASMKQRLDKQQIVNKELMRKVMRAKTSWLNLLVKAELIAIPFVYLLIAGICYVYGVSQWYSFAFLVGATIDSLLDIRTVRIPANLFGSSSILDLKRLLVRQKKERFIQTCIGIVFCIVWVLLFDAAMIASDSGIYPESDLWNSARTGGMIGGVIGAVFGCVIVIVLYRKMQNTSNQLLSEIEKLENED